MRWSRAFIPTLRDDPADAESASHRLLVRGGFIRQLMAGAWSALPLGQRVAGKIEGILREEMDKLGAQEFRLPALHPAELWRKSGRWESVGEELFRMKDRHGSDLCLGMTHEEVFAWLARELRSYKELPQIWYQIQTKFRDEARPKGALLRVREFVMKDSYSFDVDRAGLDRAFQAHFEAYRRIFERCGVETLAVEASSGSMGGSESVEFMVASDAGEDWIASCASCGYAANTEKATSTLPPVGDGPGLDAPEKFPTPGVRTIEDLAQLAGGAAADRQIKTLVYMLDDKLVLALLRGDHSLVEQKLEDGVECKSLRPASEAEIRQALGAGPGSLGAVGVTLPVVADLALQGRRDMTTGANEDGFHLRGVDVGRDLQVTGWLDLREVMEGEACPMCHSALHVRKSIEVGHIFKLGTKYSETLGTTVQNEDGQQIPVIMGCYGIGIPRIAVSAVEQGHDEHGILWPMSIAPYEVVVTVVNPKDVATREAGERLYEALQAEGIDVILDDRDERPGVKFKDAELVGIPYRITVGPRGLKEGKVELLRRRGSIRTDVALGKAVETVRENVLEERR